MTAHARLPQCSFGNGSIGGTVFRPTKVPSSSGAVGRNSRYARIIALRVLRRPRRSGPRRPCSTGCAWNRKLVTTPKLPPPPRSAQKRSGCSLLARGDEAAVGQHHVGFEQVVDRQAVLARQVAGAAAEGEARDAGGRDDAEGHRQPERVRGVIDVARGAAGLDPDRAVRRDPRARPSSSTGRSPGRRRSCRGRGRCGRRRGSRREGRCSRPKFTAAMTSATSTQRAIRRGRLSIMPL